MPRSESQVMAGGSVQDRNSPAVDCSLSDAIRRWRSPERPGVYHHPKILDYLRRFEAGLRLVHHNPQLAAEIEDHLKVMKERFARGRLDEPVVEVPPHADTPRMENGGNRSHDLWSCGEAKAKGRELVHVALCHKPKEATRVRMDRDLQVGFLEVDGGHTVALTNRKKDRLDGLHAEVRHIHEQIEGREIDDESPRPRGLPHYKKPREGRGASSTALLAIRASVTSLSATPLVDKGWYDGREMGTLDSGGSQRKGMR